MDSKKELISLGKRYFENKEYAKAIEELKQVTEDKSCPIQEAFHLLGLAHLKRREQEQARTQLERCIQLNPKSCIAEECQHLSKLM